MHKAGSPAFIAGIRGSPSANIVSMDQISRDESLHTFHIEVHRVQHLMRILAALRAADLVSTAERL